MAAQLGQGLPAKDTEDGARIGAAVSEREKDEDIGRSAAEDPTARELAQRQDAMALPLQGLATYWQPDDRADTGDLRNVGVARTKCSGHTFKICTS